MCKYTIHVLMILKFIPNRKAVGGISSLKCFAVRKVAFLRYRYQWRNIVRYCFQPLLIFKLNNGFLFDGELRQSSINIIGISVVPIKMHRYQFIACVGRRIMMRLVRWAKMRKNAYVPRNQINSMKIGIFKNRGQALAILAWWSDIAALSLSQNLSS